MDPQESCFHLLRRIYINEQSTRVQAYFFFPFHTRYPYQLVVVGRYVTHARQSAWEGRPMGILVS